MKKRTNFWVYSLMIVSMMVMVSTGCKKETVDPTPNNSNPIPTTVTDVDGNVYHTVKIGTQTWMVENLKVTHYRNGDPIPYFTNYELQDNIGYTNYCNTTNSDTINTYGRLYDWYVVNDTRKIAPTGWHIPTVANWITLITYLGGDSVAGGKMKETGTTHWLSPNTGATNSSGFTALPGGICSTHGYPGGMGFCCWWWSSDAWDVTKALGCSIQCDDDKITISYQSYGAGTIPKNEGLSVRLVHD